MPNYTANFSLPYPNGDDAPCDFAAQWCDFAAAVNAVFDRFQITIDRTVPVVPLGILGQTTPRVITTTSPNMDNTYEFVRADTAGWIDYDANPSAIFPDRVATYYFSANAVTAIDGVNSNHHLNITSNGNLGVAHNTILDRGAAGHILGNWASSSYPQVPPVTITTPIYISPSTNVTVNSANLAVMWHADSVRPA